MDVEQASVFLGASILLMLGVTVIISGIVFINNLLHHYWKPVKISLLSTTEPMLRFATEEEIKESNLKKDK